MALRGKTEQPPFFPPVAFIRFVLSHKHILHFHRLKHRISLTYAASIGTRYHPTSTIISRDTELLSSGCRSAKTQSFNLITQTTLESRLFFLRSRLCSVANQFVFCDIAWPWKVAIMGKKKEGAGTGREASFSSSLLSSSSITSVSLSSYYLALEKKLKRAIVFLIPSGWKHLPRCSMAHRLSCR